MREWAVNEGWLIKIEIKIENKSKDKAKKIELNAEIVNF